MAQTLDFAVHLGSPWASQATLNVSRPTTKKNLICQGSFNVSHHYSLSVTSSGGGIRNTPRIPRKNVPSQFGWGFTGDKAGRAALIFGMGNRPQPDYRRGRGCHPKQCGVRRPRLPAGLPLASMVVAWPAVSPAITSGIRAMILATKQRAGSFTPRLPSPGGGEAVRRLSG